MGGQSATHRRQERPQQVRRRHARRRHLNVQEPRQIRRRKRRVGESNRPWKHVDSEDYRAGGLPKAIARVRQGLHPAAERDKDDRRAIPPRIGRGRRLVGNKFRGMEARTSAGRRRTRRRARGALPTEGRTRRRIVGARHGNRRAPTRAQGAGRAVSAARASTAAPAMPTRRVRAKERQHRRRGRRRSDGNEVAVGALPHELREGGGRRRGRRRGRWGHRRRRNRRRRRRQN